MVSPKPDETRPDVLAQNHASGCQYLGPGDGDQNVVSSNGVQFNDRSDRRQYTTLALHLQAGGPGIPSVWNLAEALNLSKTEPVEPTTTVLKDWLMRQEDSPLDVNRQHLDIISQRAPGTGQWMIASKELQQWKDPSNRSHGCIGIHGILGSGKTVLASLVIDTLKSELSEKQESVSIYFYFHEGDEKSPPVARIWSTLLMQLLQHPANKQISEALKVKFNNSFRGSAPIHPLEYFDLFRAQSSLFKTVYLVIDALDSCTNTQGERTRQILQEALRKLPGNIRVLFTSRRESLIRDLDISTKIEVTPRAEDIGIYVQDRINVDAELRRVLENTDHQEMVIDKVTKLTMKSGMFLLAKLHLHNLTKQGTLADIKEALQQLPTTSYGAFEVSIRKILRAENPYETDLAKHVFTWVVHAKAGLTVDQIRESFAIQKSHGLPYQDSLPPRDAIISCCAGLIVEDHETNTLRLVHESVKDHLQRHEVLFQQPGSTIAKVCLMSLLMMESKQSQSSLLVYAAKYWCSHLCKPMDAELMKLIKAFLSDRERLESAFKMLREVPGLSFRGITGLHVAVWFNQLAWIERLLRSGTDINSKCSNGQTPLHWAALLGRYRILSFFVQKAADVNIQDKSGDTALHKLLMGPMTEGTRDVQCLIRAGARIDLKGSKGLTPLSSAIRYGPTSIALLMIENQQHVDMEVTEGWTSLKEVFYHAHEMIHKLGDSGKGKPVNDGWTPLREAVRAHVSCLIEALLRKGVDLNRPTSDGWLPVLHLVKSGNAEVLQKLLERQPDPANASQRDANDGRSALHWAFYYKRYSAIKLLLKHGADVNEMDPDGSTPLIQAIRERNEDMVWLLLKKGAQVNQKDGKGWLPLHHSIECKNKDIVWLLIANKANVQLRHINVPSVLGLALRKSEYPIAWLLCQAGADINEVDNGGMTSLHRACRDGRLKEVQFLLSNGVELAAKDTAGSTALHYAVLGGRVKILELILSQSPARHVIDEPDGKGNTALLLAILQKSRPMLQSLLISGASCEEQGSAGLTALHLAASLGFNAGLELLMSRTNDIDETDSQGYNAIHHAINSKDASESTILILAEGGVDLEAEDLSGLTPLMLAVHLGKVRMTRELIAQGANVYTRNDRGWTAIDLVNSQGYQSREHSLIRAYLLEGPLSAEEPIY